MNLSDYKVHAHKRRDDHLKRRRWMTSLMQRIQLNPIYAVEKIRPWLHESIQDLPLKIFSTERNQTIHAITKLKDSSSDKKEKPLHQVVFSIQSDIFLDQCDCWNGTTLIPFDRSNEPGEDKKWPLTLEEKDIVLELTSDALNHIFNYLTLRDLRQCSRVCKSWCEVIESSEKLFKLIPREFRNYPEKRWNTAKHAYDIRPFSNMRMASLFAPWELYDIFKKNSNAHNLNFVGSCKLNGIPNNRLLMESVFDSWIKELAPIAYANLKVLVTGIIDNRPFIGIEATDPLFTKFKKFRILLRSRENQKVNLGPGSLRITGSCVDLTTFLLRISDLDGQDYLDYFR